MANQSKKNTPIKTLSPVILFEDEWILVVNKPAGMVVNRAESVTEVTVQDWVEHSNKLQATSNKTEIKKVFLARSGIAHRLDKETSGVLVIAKDPETLRELMRQFKAREVHKEYLALVHGRLEPSQGWFHVPIKRKGIGVRKFGVGLFGKISDTDYRVSKYLWRDTLPYTLVILWPKTGRTHQLRVQLAFYKHPIVADKLYLPEKMYQVDQTWCPRHFLHAQTISFRHPKLNRQLMIKAPLWKDLSDVVEQF